MNFWLSLGRDDPIPLYQQIYEQIREKILHGVLQSGEKLPSTRAFANDLHVSRNVVLEAYDRLIAEGYLDNRPGSGTYVAAGARLADFHGKPHKPFPEAVKPPVSDPTSIDFRSGVPALDHIPVREIKQVLYELLSSSPASLWNYGEPEGCPDLRKHLVPYLYKTRGVYCDADQIMVTTGTVQSLAILARLLLKSEDEVVIEDPTNLHMQRIFLSQGAIIRPVPVDHFGLDTSLLDPAYNPRYIYTSPSHQFPLGSVMSIQRRLELIQYARTKHCYILEDDYDSEFRYNCAPISSLQGLDPERVIYIGTFSKILAPGFRIGYVILPRPLVAPCRELKKNADHHSPLLEQHIIARMLENGSLVRHISRMLKIYKKRQKNFLDSLKTHFPYVEISGDSTGIHIIADFGYVEFTSDLVRAIEERGVRIYPVENHAIHKGRHKSKAIFGYVNLTPDEIDEGLRRLKSVIAERR